MVNMLVEWAGPDASLLTLTRTLTERHGQPTRPYEYVTGYKSPANISGHNADSNGRGHSVDIFVGPGQNISIEQGIDLAERLRIEGTKGTIAGHPDRLAYIIHRGRIAGDHTGWEWVAYTGKDGHYDHIHVSSTFDYYWGDAVWESGLDYNSTASWDLWEEQITATPPPTATGPVGGPTGWIVEAGNTMSYIAAETGVSLQALLSANPGVYANLIFPGQTLNLPTGAKWPAAQMPATQGGPIQWTVNPGDNLTYIANKSGVSLASVIAANPGIDPDYIVPGQVLRLPAGATW